MVGDSHGSLACPGQVYFALLSWRRMAVRLDGASRWLMAQAQALNASGYFHPRAVGKCSRGRGTPLRFHLPHILFIFTSQGRGVAIFGLTVHSDPTSLDATSARCSSHRHTADYEERHRGGSRLRRLNAVNELA